MPKFEAKIVSIQDETPRVKTFRVTWPGIETFTFLPGQFMMLSVPGFVNAAGITVKRAYSIASAPADKGFLDFTITAKSPVGLSSRCHQLKVGETVIAEGPAGHFGLKKPLHNLTFIAAGSGISSLRSMYRQLLLEGYAEPITVLSGFKTPADSIFKDELRHLAHHHKNFHVIMSITADDPSWVGLKGRVTAVIPKVFTDAIARHYYLCGPPEMVNDTITVLTGMGVPRAQIFREAW
ncbi:hypothetical protein HY492_03625 [Candidatus Woesearchaeota archaeon]|nr:hypothetical protein [Candidatus Woesearchaeota archaeon]